MTEFSVSYFLEQSFLHYAVYIPLVVMLYGKKCH